MAAPRTKACGSERVIGQGHIFAAFDRGQIPTISVVNQSSKGFGGNYPDFNKVVAALQHFVDGFFAPVWGTKCYLAPAKTVAPGTWGLVFMDHPDVQDAYGYHDLTKDGLPLSKIFIDVCLESGEQPSITASHELAEMLVDPGIQLCAMDQRGVLYAYETADADEGSSFAIDGVSVTNFVYPSWFEGFRRPKSTKFDQLGRIDRPFRIMKGGYMSIFKGGAWSNIFGSKAAEKKFNLVQHNRAKVRITQRQISTKA